MTNSGETTQLFTIQRAPDPFTEYWKKTLNLLFNFDDSKDIPVLFFSDIFRSYEKVTFTMETRRHILQGHIW